MRNTIELDRIKGALYGFAIGDAMGATTEFMTEVSIMREYGKVSDIIGGGWLKLEAGQVTDDTQMMMCVIDSIMKLKGKEDLHGRLFVKECKNKFINWYHSEPKDIGNQCRKAIEYLIATDAKSCKHDKNALGNGSLMRALPCALLDEPLLNHLQGKLTHNNSVCLEAIQSYHADISNLIKDIPTRRVNYSTRLMQPTGHVVNTLNNAVYWSNMPTFEEAIIGAVNHGGDADTIAALTGGLSGARFGYKMIPKRWVNQLDKEVRAKLDKFVDYISNLEEE